MPEIHYLLLIALLIVSTVLWLQQRQTRNAGWVDVFWAWSVGIVGMSFLVTGNGALVPRVAAGVLLLLWSSVSYTHLTLPTKA